MLAVPSMRYVPSGNAHWLQTISYMRDLTSLAYDPDVLRTLSFPKLDDQVFLEFDQVPCWHS